MKLISETHLFVDFILLLMEHSVTINLWWSLENKIFILRVHKLIHKLIHKLNFSVLFYYKKEKERKSSKIKI
jgi:hypothetical protein